MSASGARLQIAVVGPGDADSDLCATAERVGQQLARAGAVVITGGLGGVMAAAARGAREAGGRTVGLLPSASRADANEWLDVVIPTGMGEARNVLLVAATDGVIAVGGSWGTLAETALALRSGRPVVGLGTWSVQDATGRAIPGGPVPADSADHAVRLVLAAVGRDQDHS